MAKNLSPANTANSTQMVAAVVARGRTIYVGTSVTKTFDRSLNMEVEVVKAADPRGPGETVELPAAEVAWLTQLGFLIAPENVVQSVQQSDASSLTLLDRSEVGFMLKAF